MRVRRWLALGAVALVSVGAMTAAVARPQSAPSQGTMVSRSLTQQSCFQSGSGATFYRPCVSVHGNIYSIQAPSGVEHVNIGTARRGVRDLCGLRVRVRRRVRRVGLRRADDHPAERPEHPAAHDRADRGGFRLTQTYALDKLQRKIDVTMAVRNSSNVSQTNVTSPGSSTGTSTTPTSTTSTTSRWTRCGVGRRTALALQAITLAPSHDVAIESFTQLVSGGLAAGSAASRQRRSDRTGRLGGSGVLLLPVDRSGHDEDREVHVPHHVANGHRSRAAVRRAAALGVRG
jgi:hypothetical protein